MTLYFDDHDIQLRHGQAASEMAAMPAGSVNCVVTSPPYYGLRDYGVEGQLGLEDTPTGYVDALRAVFTQARRILRPDGVLWLNLGDSYSTRKIVRDSSHQPGFHPDRADHETIGKTWAQNAAEGNARMPGALGVPEKNLLGIPWRTAFALQDDGWILRNSIIWHKPNAMPESVTDRLSTRHENVFMFSKSRRYWFDLDPIREPLTYPDAADGSRVFGGKNKAADLTTGSSARRTGNRYGAVRDWANSEQGNDHDAASPRGRNPGDVWTISTSPFPGAHFATMPPALARRCILAGCPDGGLVLDPFAGSGTTLMVARQLGRRGIGIDLKAEYLDIAIQRIGQPTLEFGEATA